jgi:hypothetical protein
MLLKSDFSYMKFRPPYSDEKEEIYKERYDYMM